MLFFFDYIHLIFDKYLSIISIEVTIENYINKLYHSA